MAYSVESAFCEGAQTVENNSQMHACLQSHLGTSVRKGEQVLLCYPDRGTHSIFTILEDAVCKLGAVPVRWKPDCRWQTLLKQAFSSRATVVIGLPRIVLGLAKLARATNTPLNIRNVLLAEAPCDHWMSASIGKALDAKISNCAAVEEPSCEKADPLTLELDNQLLPWSSILDYRMSRTEMGLSLEIIIFPGAQLPRLPSGAKVILRPWNARQDIPFCLEML